MALQQLTALLQGLWLGHPRIGQVRGQGADSTTPLSPLCFWWRPGAGSGERGGNNGSEAGAEEEKGASLVRILKVCEALVSGGGSSTCPWSPLRTERGHL